MQDHATPQDKKKVDKRDKIFLSRAGRKLSWNLKDGHEAVKSMNDGTEQADLFIYERA